MKRKKLINFLFGFLILLFVLAPSTVLAKKTVGDASAMLNQTTERTGIEQTDVFSLSGRIIKALLGISGLAFFVLMIYGGFLWMTARGSEEQVTKAKNTIIAAIIGLVVVVSAYAITNFIAVRLIEGQRNENLDLGPDRLGEEVLGCCIDQTGEYVYAARITTFSDCQERQSEEFDGLQGDAWQFYENIEWIECEQIYLDNWN